MEKLDRDRRQFPRPKTQLTRIFNATYQVIRKYEITSFSETEPQLSLEPLPAEELVSSEPHLVEA